MHVAVLTTSEIQVYETSLVHPDRIDEEIKRKYGRQSNGLPHNWTGVYSIERIQKQVQDFCSGSKSAVEGDL